MRLFTPFFAIPKLGGVVLLKKNADLIIDSLLANDQVLDIGGWHTPFNRANYVIDVMPYETRGCGGHFGPNREYFTKETWIIHDLCSRKRLPFKDKEVEFVICSHVLEDIRDPIWVCSELMRVAKRGYIEVPSRIVEQTMGLDGEYYAGYYHHRWLVDIEGNRITFRFKSHLIHEMWQCHFPRSFLEKVAEDERVRWLFFENHFDALEAIQISKIETERELMLFVNKHYQYPKFYYMFDSEWSGPKPQITLKKVIKKLIRSLPGLRNFRRASPINPDLWEGLPEIESRADT
jgi:hypothetical protein